MLRTGNETLKVNLLRKQTFSLAERLKATEDLNLCDRLQEGEG